MNYSRTFSQKFLSLFLLFSILACFSNIVFAADSSWIYPVGLPKWTHITFVAGGVQDPDSNGRYLVGGDVVLYDPDNRIDLTATVQKYNSGWKDTGYSWSSSAYAVTGVAERVYLSKGRYRMKLAMKVYSPTGTLLEDTVLYTGETLV